MVDSWERARSILEYAEIPPDRLAHLRPLTGGTYNTVEELRLTDGSRYVVKVAPDAPGLRYESRLLVAEAEFYRGAETAGVPAPRLVALDDESPVLLMTACSGEPWDGSLTESERACLRTELGCQVAALHRVTGTAFGYPSGALGPLAPDWRTAFTGMLDAILDDARRFAARLPRPVEEIAGTLRVAYGALDGVTVPALVHFDLWDGNILVERSAESVRIGGLIDGERMFWGDPLAEFVSLALLGDIRKDEAFLTGYREGGGRAEFDRPALLRLALYRAYLYLIMLVETVPRAMGEGDIRWREEAVAPELVAALDEIEEATS
ncbi:phosphotransferase family protein [Streptomyces guryensis]|uniref:Aminoglycoside phosphotransferase family protein n=1 Tax=Streptomyces guryensis TaxID=2886947 RepID=A0A9Q3VNW6_9ACTN|nr:aminoglycoside phosphotransferase family protein [Streptomyces guryensis]MCD9874431.1 aminoglycoside phosphotransferase family protein [Streptomyces guryensis]